MIYEGVEIADNLLYTTGLVVDNNNRIGHNGSVIGYHSDLWYDKKLKTTVAVLTNISGKKDYSRNIINEIFEILNKKINEN